MPFPPPISEAVSLPDPLSISEQSPLAEPFFAPMPPRRQPTSKSSSSYDHLSKADRAAYMARAVPTYSTLPIQDQVQPIIPARALPFPPPISEAVSLPDPLPISEQSPLAEPFSAPSTIFAHTPAPEIPVIAAPLLAPMVNLSLTAPLSSPNFSAISFPPIVDEPLVGLDSSGVLPTPPIDDDFLAYQRFLKFRADSTRHAQFLRFEEQERSITSSLLRSSSDRPLSPHSSESSLDSRKRTRSPPAPEHFVRLASDSDSDSDTTAPPFIPLRAVPFTNSTHPLSDSVAPRSSRVVPPLKAVPVAPSPAPPAGFPSLLLCPPSPSVDSPPSSPWLDTPPMDTPVSAPIMVAAPLVISSESAVTLPRQIAISEGIISLVDANITPEIATAFHRQMLRSVHRDDPAHTAISGEALHKLDITIQSDGAQTFIPTSFFPDWTHRITCTRLSEIVLHYFGPRINTTQTIEQAFKAIPFIYDIFNKQDEQDTYCEMAILLQLYERKRGAPFSADLNASLAHILEKRITANSKIHQDFLVRKAQDRLNKIPESPLHSMKRLCLCNDAVRQAALLLDSYPTTRHFHSFKGSSLTGTFVTIAKDISRADIARTYDGTSSPGITAPMPPLRKVLPVLPFLPPLSPLTITMPPVPSVVVHAPVMAALIPRPAGTAATTFSYTCHTCGLPDHQRKECPHGGARDANHSRIPWNASPIGLLWAAHGHESFQSGFLLPDCPRQPRPASLVPGLRPPETPVRRIAPTPITTRTPVTAVGIATDVIAPTAIATIVTAMIVTAPTEIETATLTKARPTAEVRNLFYSSPRYIQTLLSRHSFKRSFTCLKG